MPNLLAHTLIVKRFYNHHNEKETESFLYKNYDFLSLGALGPDPLFYVGILPSTGLHIPTALKKIGNKLHYTDGKTFFKLLIQESYSIENILERNRFEAFVFGQFAHYLLDRETHPYILYESGFDEKGKITGNYHYYHAFFESNIDCALALKYSLKNFIKEPNSIIPVNESNLRMLDRHIVPILSHMYSTKITKKMYSNAVKNMYRLLKSMNHHGAFKSKLLGHKIALSAMYQPINPDLTTLNEDKTEWMYPCDGVKSTESFIDMYNRCYSILESCYMDIQLKGFNFDTFAKYFDGRNYYGDKQDSMRQYKRTTNKV